MNEPSTTVQIATLRIRLVRELIEWQIAGKVGVVDSMRWHRRARLLARVTGRDIESTLVGLQIEATSTRAQLKRAKPFSAADNAAPIDPPRSPE